jgi:hypothetical protein
MANMKIAVRVRRSIVKDEWFLSCPLSPLPLVKLISASLQVFCLVGSRCAGTGRLSMRCPDSFNGECAYGKVDFGSLMVDVHDFIGFTGILS